MLFFILFYFSDCYIGVEIESTCKFTKKCEIIENVHKIGSIIVLGSDAGVFLNIAKRLKKPFFFANNVTPLRNNKCTIRQEFFFFEKQ